MPPKNLSASAQRFFAGRARRAEAAPRQRQLRLNEDEAVAEETADSPTEGAEEKDDSTEGTEDEIISDSADSTTTS